jgi:hypothetical protein
MSLGAVHILAVLLVLSLVFLSISIYFNVKFGMMILGFQDNVEECLDIIDERYRSISQVLEIPIFFDSVEVRQVINDISRTREAILVVANKLTVGSVEYEESEGEGEP